MLGQLYPPQKILLYPFLKPKAGLEVVLKIKFTDTRDIWLHCKIRSNSTQVTASGQLSN
jgi:hypothetical protein